MTQEKFCPQCGTKLPADAVFCRNCGYKFSEQPQAPQQTPSTPTPQPTSTSTNRWAFLNNPNFKKWATIGGVAIGLALVVIITMNVIFQKQQEAKQKAEQASVARVSRSRSSSESKIQSTERRLSKDAVDVVTNMIQDDFDLDAEATDVTVERHTGGDHYSGYASVEDDYGDSTSVDINITDVKYEKSVSVEIPDTSKLYDEFDSND